ncbi:unnamed protein product [Ambrosiozyma monospora]|uniref:Unnamed protein product n=1 Tax=Ambrosiozyma monospora TaxID=43982 RepID=A0ACB5U365_AMBMO|nr:unnamed protein product [Ambrosiozyma monospora]
MHSPTLRVRPFKFEDVNAFSVTYSWNKDAEDNDHLEVFPKGGAFPSTKMLTLYRTSDFEVDAFYTHPEQLPKGTDHKIAHWKITGVEVPEGSDSATVKVKVRNDPSGFFTIESAYIVEEKEFKELVEKDPPAEGEEEAEPEYKIVKKLVKTKDLQVAYSGHALPEKELAELLEKEFKMVADDKLVAETEDRKNALEEYIYELRGKLEDQYKDFASEQERETLSKKLMDTEEWLYEDGYDAKKAKYIAKYEELASIGNLIKGRYMQKQQELKDKLRSKQEAASMAKMAEKLAASRGEKKDTEGDVKMEDQLD